MKIAILSLFLFLSCSNLSKNLVKSGNFTLRNGVAADKTWNENLSFKRYSWFQEMSLFYEALLGDLSPQSSFNNWFSAEELKEINKCADFKVVLLYSLDSKKISNGLFFEQVERANYQKIEISNFKRNLMLHPDSNENSFSLYQVYGLCKKTKDLIPLMVSFPGFQEVTLR